MSRASVIPILVGLVSLSCGASAGEIAPGRTERALTMVLYPIEDTWYETTPVGSHVDRGRSCELKTNNLVSEPQPYYIALKFEFAQGVCSTLQRAALRLKTTQAAQSGLVVHPRNISSSWKAGSTGLSGCFACNVSSGSPQTNPLPTYEAPLVGQAITQSCVVYEWDVTSIVQRWCMQGSVYPSLMLTGLSGTGVATFHSADSPAGNRPQLTIWY